MHSTAHPLRNLLLVAVVAALCFGGSFTCEGSTHDDDRPPSTGVSGSVNVR
jgi:hypothetical protein